MTKQEIMKKAWTIAKDAQSQFGYSVKSYFPESLKLAWKEEKMNLKNMSLDELNELKSQINKELEERVETKNVIFDFTPKTASGRRESWAKHVTSVDMTKKNGYAFDGEFISVGENEIPVGAVILEVCPCGSVKNSHKEANISIMKSDGTLDIIDSDLNWSWEFITIRNLIQKELE